MRYATFALALSLLGRKALQSDLLFYKVGQVVHSGTSHKAPYATWFCCHDDCKAPQSSRQKTFPLFSKHNKLCNLAFYYVFIFCAVSPRRSGFVIAPASRPVRPQRGLPVLRASAAPPPPLKHKGRVLAAGAARTKRVLH